jgi:hypothetical protein
LNAGLWFRRARFVIDSLLIRSHPGRYQAETPLIALFKFAEPALSKRRLAIVCRLILSLSIRMVWPRPK